MAVVPFERFILRKFGIETFIGFMRYEKLLLDVIPPVRIDLKLLPVMKPMTIQHHAILFIKSHLIVTVIMFILFLIFIAIVLVGDLTFTIMRFLVVVILVFLLMGHLRGLRLAVVVLGEVAVFAHGDVVLVADH